MRLPSGSWTRWKWTSCSATALYIRTGTLTRPKEMAPVQMARGTASSSSLWRVTENEAIGDRQQRFGLLFFSEAHGTFIAVMTAVDWDVFDLEPLAEEIRPTGNGPG